MSTQYSEYLSLCRERFSERKFLPKEVGRETLLEVMEAVRLAPSACNRQPWKFVIVTGGPTLDALRKAYRRDGFREAPVTIICLGLHDEAWVRPTDGKDHTDIDLAIAIEHLCLAATARGLATCWVCSFDVEAVRACLSLPEGVEPVAMIPLGWPVDEAPEKTRKNIAEITEWIAD